MNEEALIERIEDWAKSTPAPLRTSDSRTLSPQEAKGLSCFSENLSSEGIFSSKYLRYNADLIPLLSPEAFRRYLPNLILTGMKLSDPSVDAYDYIILMLDRSPDHDLWCERFKERWAKLSIEQLSIIEEWLLWLSDKDEFDELSITRSFDTIGLLKEVRQKDNSDTGSE